MCTFIDNLGPQPGADGAQGGGDSGPVLDQPGTAGVPARDGVAGRAAGGDAGSGAPNGKARKPYHMLTREDRSKGGTKSASNQGRDEYGQFAGRRPRGQQ
jgi:hypothetical protein